MKHTRLLEIIREEIAGALNEKTALGPGALGDKDFQKAFTRLPGDEKEKVKKGLQSGNETFVFEEDLLNEEPFIDSALDITGTTPENFNQDALQNAIDDAVKVLQQENPDADVKTLAGKLQKANNPVNLGPKSKLSSELKNALQKVNDVIVKQGQIFGSIDNINDLIKLAKEPSQIDRLEKLKEKGYTFILGNPQAITAIEKSLGLKPKNNDFLGAVKDKAKAEKSSKVKTSTPKNPKAKAEPKSKVATLTKGDDGFDTVEYSDVDSGDKEATQNIGSDPTAQKLGKVAYSKNLTPEEETQYKTARDGINAKIKRIEDGEEKPNDRALLQRAYQNSEIQRLYKAKGLSLDDILKGIIG